MIFDEEADLFAFDAYEDAERRSGSWQPSKPRPRAPDQAVIFPQRKFADHSSPVVSLMNRIKRTTGSLLPTRNPLMPDETFAASPAQSNTLIVVLLVLVIVFQVQCMCMSFMTYSLARELRRP